MMGLGMPELIVIAIVLMVLFGPSQMPKMGRSIGETIREFRNAGKILREDDDRK